MAKYTEYRVTDNKGNGGANHNYIICAKADTLVPGRNLGTIMFQDGPIKETGVNGIMNEDLLEILIHRMECFQAGPYVCRENALALTKLQEALMWLEKRTSDREARKVEGTHEI